MIISDLNHLEVVSEDAGSVSGGLLFPDFKFNGIPLPAAQATVQLSQQAIGFQTSTQALVQNDVVAGLFSKSVVLVQTTAVGASG
jgi:hypothetical protein